MSRQGRNFEKLISILEKGLSRPNICIKSPDFFIDRITNTKREVDISIRQKIGNLEIVTVVECRDRQAIEDVTWIEQLVSKTKDINISRVFAVSSSGFSDAAKMKAEYYGIELHTIKEITNENLENWIIPCELISIIGNHHIIDAAIISDNTSVNDVQIPLDMNTPYFKQTNGQLYSLNDFFNMIPKISSHYPPVNENVQATIKNSTQKQVKTFRLDFRSNDIRIENKSEWIKIDGIELKVELWNEIRVISSEKMFAYLKGEKRLAGGSKFPITIDKFNFDLIVHIYKNSNGQIIKSTLVSKNGKVKR